MFKESIMNLKGYHPSVTPCDIILDANESYVNPPYNRYPDPTATILRQWIAKDLGIMADEVIVGNGSSEMIDLIMKCVLSPGDKVLTFEPTFSIYALNASILGAATKAVPLNGTFQLDVDGFIETMDKEEAKMVILCNPNNPTGTLLPAASVSRIIESTEALVVVDEAYIEFGGESVVDKINQYDNLIVLRTFSKAYGLAGARLGYMVANDRIVEIVNKVRPPYNLSTIAQNIGLETLEKKDKMLAVIETIKKERQRIFNVLKDYVRVYPSGGNFLFFQTDHVDLYEVLLSESIRIRRYDGTLKGYYRLTIGTEDENNAFIKVLRGLYE